MSLSVHCFTLLGLLATSFAQSNTGGACGRLTDSTGAVVPKVGVAGAARIVQLALKFYF